MKKRILSIILLGTIVATTLIGFVGCGKEEETADYEETITTEIDSSIPNITELSKAEILAMSADEVKQSVETYLPNYKNIYGIAEDEELSDEDWTNLAAIICIQLYGSATIESTSETEEGYSEDAVADIYTAPTYEDIEPMSLSEFAIYMNAATDAQYGEAYRTENELDYTTMSDEELQEMKNDLLKSLSE